MGKEGSSMAGVGRSHLPRYWKRSSALLAFICRISTALYHTIRCHLYYTQFAHLYNIALSTARSSTLEHDVLPEKYHLIPSQGLMHIF